MCFCFGDYPINNVCATDCSENFQIFPNTPDDQDVTRFVWVRDLKEPPEGKNLIVYRFRRLPFGIVSSPFLLAAVLKTHLAQYSSEVEKKLLKNLYLDNIVFTTNDQKLAIEAYKESKIFAEAFMNLRTFISNEDG